MKVYIVTNEPFPNGMAATNRIRCYAKALLQAGVECEVVICIRTEVCGKPPKNTECRGAFEEVPFRYIGCTPIRNRNLLLRWLNDKYDKIKTIIYLKKIMKAGDVILCYCSDDSFCVRLQSFSHNHGYKIVTDLCEYPYATTNINWGTQSRGEKYFRTIIRAYDGTLCISQALLEEVQKYNPTGYHLKVPILIDQDKWNFDAVESKKIDAPYLFHSGALFQQKDGIIDVLNAFADALPFLPKGTKYLFTGNVEDSTDRNIINQTIEERHLTASVQFLGYLSKDLLMQYIKGASAFIIYKNDNLQNRYCFATKMGEYLLSGNPLITTTIGEAKYFLKDGYNSYLVNACDIGNLSKAIIRCINNPDTSRSIGKCGKKVTEEYFCVKSQSKAIKKYFETISS